ncbi:MAG TPA: hypothetical protein VFD69_09865, partial [Vicinamibacterales bacterium]|nr:hypothetical protein [Vicinamibacterales bacterium]
DGLRVRPSPNHQSFSSLRMPRNSDYGRVLIHMNGRFSEALAAALVRVRVLVRPWPLVGVAASVTWAVDATD